MDRVTRYNVIALSGKAVEACGDVDTMILDKTGTITYGNRLAADFIPVEGIKKEDLIDYAVMTSLSDATPEGKSVVELGKTMGTRMEESAADQVEFVEFTAQSKMSGVNLEDGTQIRKGAFDAIKKYVAAKGGKIPSDLEKIVTDISSLGGTPLVVCVENVIYGVIYLKDTVKPGLVERFDRLREIGIKTIMCTGDNPLTAATIAKEAGVDGFIAECKPEDKIDEIKKEQAEGKIVAMTGDGTNDAPALAQADVGLAMNSGTSAAKEAANMVDLDSDPTKILEVVGDWKTASDYERIPDDIQYCKRCSKIFCDHSSNVYTCHPADAGIKYYETVHTIQRNPLCFDLQCDHHSVSDPDCNERCQI